MVRRLSTMERKGILTALQEDEGLRIDGRPLHGFRPVTITPDPQTRGLVTVDLGHGEAKTKVFSTVSATLSRPSIERPAEGMVSFYVEIFGGSRNVEEFRSSGGRSDASEMVELERDGLQRLIERILKATRILDLESLCVVPGEQVWAVRVDLHVLQAKGSLIDALSIAAVASLYDFRRPDVSVDVETGAVTVYSEFERHPIPLTLSNPPIAVSLLLLDPLAANSDHASLIKGSRMLIMADASDTEEGLLIDGAGGATRLIMAFNALGELLVMSRSGGGIVSDHLFSGPCFSLASARAKSILSYIQKSVSRT